MTPPKIAVVSFPGNNCEVESIRAIKEAGMEVMYFRWNDDRTKLEDVDGYFLPGGFAYEDRGRSGMVAARDPLMEFIKREAEEGKVVIGNCNGAQVLVESGLIPLGNHLTMSLARNAIKTSHGWLSPGFINEWVWIRPACAPDRCATSDWGEGQEHRRTMHLPIAHGEGRFTTKDKDLLAELEKNNQIAFQYCDAAGNVSEDSQVNPNGAIMAIAGICNPAGNVVALMPHPERTPNGAPYFASVRKWFEKTQRTLRLRSGQAPKTQKTQRRQCAWELPKRSPRPLEIFIDTIIVNNEERTVEQAARRIAPELRLKQWKYIAPEGMEPKELLRDLALFNPNKERAYVRRAGRLHRWHAEEKREEPLPADCAQELFSGISLLRRDEPDTGASGFPVGSETGVCYTVSGIRGADLLSAALLEVFANRHASVLEVLMQD